MLSQIEEIAVGEAGFPLIIYGPEGCGKTALLMDRGIPHEIIEDPDKILRGLMEPEVQKLERKLIGLNLAVYIWGCDEKAWIDKPPPEEDLKLGGCYAWQTPIHREAVRRVLGEG